MKLLLIAVTLLMAATAQAEEATCFGVDYESPVAGWTAEELEYSTLECVSERLDVVKTETASIMLERICYYKVIKDAMGTYN